MQVSDVGPGCRARVMLREDAKVASAFLAQHNPEFAPFANGLPSLLDRLLQSGQLRGGLIEQYADGKVWRLAAIGLSAFISRETVSELISREAPYATRFLLERAADGHAPFLDNKAVASAARTGLHLYVVAFTHNIAALDHELGRVVFARAIEHFVYAHRGYPLRLLLREDPDSLAFPLLAAGMKTLRAFPQAAGPGSEGRMLLGYSADDARQQFPGSTVQMLFNFERPIVGFTIGECRVLALAGEGLADASVCAELAISAHTLKRTWRNIFARVEKVAPHIFRELPPRVRAKGRGPEKRQLLLRYLRDHPQEVRPNKPR